MVTSGQINLEQLCFCSVCGTYNAINHLFSEQRTKCPQDLSNDHKHFCLLLLGQQIQKDHPGVDHTKLLFFVNAKYSVFFAIKLDHFIVDTFFHTLQTLKLNSKNRKTQTVKVWLDRLLTQIETNSSRFFIRNTNELIFKQHGISILHACRDLNPRSYELM